MCLSVCELSEWKWKTCAKPSDTWNWSDGVRSPLRLATPLQCPHKAGASNSQATPTAHCIFGDESLFFQDSVCVVLAVQELVL